MYTYINNWNLAVMQCVHSNHDVKLITIGSETRDIFLYISLYVAIRQANTLNLSALLAKKLTFHKAWEWYNSHISIFVTIYWSAVTALIKWKYVSIYEFEEVS